MAPSAERRLTCQREKDDPVHYQHGPEDRYIEKLKPRAEKGDQNGTRSKHPELELRESSDEGAELFILFDREG